MESPSTASSPARDQDSADAATPFTPPRINLPTGGGAIRGIGEKFSTNAATGTGKLTVPLPLSPGRSGFGPRLSLAYDSGAGNGVFGIGWSLSNPAITRKTDKGIPKYRSRELAECDVFVLSGVEDLVPALVNGEQGEWREDQFEHGGYRVKRYRPRVEGMFARIERWTRLEDGDEHWRSIARDNSLTVYGSDPESRIFDPCDPRRIFSWLICASYDDKGNAIRYEYVAEDGDGVDPHNVSERARARTANRYLKRILYGNRHPVMLDPDAPDFRPPHLGSPGGPAVSDWMFEAVFDYGEGHYREEGSDGARRIWAHCKSGLEEGGRTNRPVRRDPFSTYRAGFEIRTYRLCQRVLMFHHFAGAPIGADCLVKSTEFTYRQNPWGSFITQVTQSGYDRSADGRFLKKSMPPLELDYTTSPLQDDRYTRYEVKKVESPSLENLPVGIDGADYAWLDLHGVGIAGVLNRRGSFWYYKPNAGNAHLGPTELVGRVPVLAAAGRSKAQLLDLAGDGSLDLVTVEAGVPGFQESTEEAGWGTFRPFRSFPVLDFNSPNLRFVDVTGDGVADILITEDDALKWHPSLQTDGFGAEIRVTVSSDERDGPHVIFDDGVQCIYLADMSGDGLSDLVRIRNGEVCYWPNMGYGTFGPKVVMENAPWFEDDDLFEQSRVKLADTDGSGTTDILYLAPEGIRIYLNQAGNGWSEPRVLREFAPPNSETSVSVVDFLGRGTACIVWSSSLPSDAQHPLQYIDLMTGQKPHLLTHIRNNLGSETRIEYASSTEFYLADQAAGTPWLTRLPFPVHVVKRAETYDYVSRNRFATSYTYHHGFFDGVEREFRGFGRVEQLDTEEFSVLTRSSVFPGEATNFDAAHNVPPVLTKTWFHTGVFLGNGRISRHLAHEYYSEPIPPDATGAGTGAQGRLAPMLLDDTILPETRTAQEAREACRALKGSLLRQEVYARDGREESSRPYTVAESNWTIDYLQPRGRNLHAVFFTHPRENLAFNYERKLYEIDGVARADPRVTHNVTLATDEYGNVLTSVSIAYGRRFTDRSALLDEKDHRKQRQLLATCNENSYTNAVLGVHAYRTPLIAEARTFELLGIAPDAAQPGTTNLFRFDELKRKIARLSDGHRDIPYEDVEARGAAPGVSHRRLIEENRTYYRANGLDGLLPIGVLQALAIPGASYKLAFTRGLLSEIYRRKETAEELIPDIGHVIHHEGGYTEIDGDGRWWIPSGQVFYSDHECTAHAELVEARHHFFQSRRFVDPFGNATTIDYDSHDLLPVRHSDSVGNVRSYKNDYRVLAPRRMVDPNNNRSEAAFDALGLVVGTATMGKAGERAGDSLDDFEANLDDATILRHIAHPLREPEAILKLATSRLVYDFWAYFRTKDTDRPQPAVVYTLARETHAAALRPGERTRIQHSFQYSDGFGRAVQKKIQAEAGPLVPGGDDIDPRWVANGWVIFNNKGKPVRQFEPFFSDSPAFEFASVRGVSPILFYDPLERIVATLHPDHVYEKVVIDPWKQATWDVNDTVTTDPLQDPDVNVFFRNLPATDYLPTWYTRRSGGELGLDEQQAARKAAAHAGTPTVSHFDPLERTFLSVAHNRFEREGVRVDDYIATRTHLDIESKSRAIVDALGRVVMRYDYDVVGNRVRQVSVDAGARWTLNDAVGRQFLEWDSRGNRLRHEYDTLHRPVGLHVRRGSATEVLAERTVYGEGQPDDVALNLRNKVFRQYDAAGLVTTERYDFKGNPLKSIRRLLRDYASEVDWSSSHDLEEHSFTTETAYDACNRIVAITTPEGSVTRSSYNESSFLESVRVHLRGAREPTDLVTNINYNAKGQRQIIAYGNGTDTHYSYDPLTFRLVHLRTTRKHDHARLQDLRYTFDPSGNITSVRDDAQETIYFKNQAVCANNEYVYDAVYRLICADGREHEGRRDGPKSQLENSGAWGGALPTDGHALHRYREHYDYDAVGNILKLLHVAPSGNRATFYSYDEADRRPLGNRLVSTRVGQDLGRYAYDHDGNMTEMPELRRLEWDFKDQLRITCRQVTNFETGERTFYVYDSNGTRVRKVTERASGSRKCERIYLGHFELFRDYDSVGHCKLARETLHVMDNDRRVALVETKTVDERSCVDEPVAHMRFQVDSHLHSTVLELDGCGAVMTHEEYYPYGGSSYTAARDSLEVGNKRYRYLGKERDEETGLYYCGARYYAPWLGRWTAADPKGPAAGSNLYSYAANNPIRASDTNGRDWRDQLSWTQRAALWLDDRVQESPVAKGIVDNLDKRGEALVKAPAALSDLAEREGPAGVAKAVAVGVGHLIKDTGEAAGDIVFEATHYQGDSSKQKIASRATDLVLNTADIVTLVDGAGAAKNIAVAGGKTLAAGGKAAVTTVKDGMTVLAAGGKGGLATTNGLVIGGTKAVATTATAAATAAPTVADTLKFGALLAVQAKAAGPAAAGGSPGSGSGPGKYRGGPHSETKGPSGDGLDSHHTPAKASSPLPPEEGPAFQMEPPDHKLTPSHGNWGAAGAAYREGIRVLLAEGKWREALTIEIRAVRQLFGSKYDVAIREMLEYAREQGLINKVPK